MSFLPPPPPDAGPRVRPPRPTGAARMRPRSVGLRSDRPRSRRARPSLRDAGARADPFVPSAQMTAGGVQSREVRRLWRRQHGRQRARAPDRGHRGLVDAAALGLMAPGSFLINCARAGLVDRAALEASLADDRLAGVGLDVWWRNPPGQTTPCSVTPASSSRHTWPGSPPARSDVCAPPPPDACSTSSSPRGRPYVRWRTAREHPRPPPERRSEPVGRPASGRRRTVEAALPASLADCWPCRSPRHVRSSISDGLAPCRRRGPAASTC